MLKAVQPVVPVLLGIILIEASLGIVVAVMGIQMASRDVPSFLIGIVFSAYFAGFLAGSLTCERLINRVGGGSHDDGLPHRRRVALERS